MDVFRITGGTPLVGQVAVGGSKNAALPILASCLLANGPVWLENVPQLVDVETLSLLLGCLGVEVKRHADDRWLVQTVDARATLADYELVRRMRASFCVLGPLLARRSAAKVSLPGGCNLGDRPVDLHLRGLEALGADVRIEGGYVIATARRLRGATIDLRGPRGPTVTGTANVLSAATLARGRSVIQGAAREPEIVDLGNFLSALGARIEGLGSSTIEIVGVDQLGGGSYRIIPDRIEAGTLLIASAITQGEVTLAGARPDHLESVLGLLGELGADICVERDRIGLRCRTRPRAAHITASPYPGVPTDLQAQFMALLALAPGTSSVQDTVFPTRFGHVAELNRLGATIRRADERAMITGVANLSGAICMASDLRASAALVLAALAARGESTVRRIYHLDRGYQQLEMKLQALGARMLRERDPEAAETTIPGGRRIALLDCVGNARQPIA